MTSTPVFLHSPSRGDPEADRTRRWTGPVLSALLSAIAPLAQAAHPLATEDAGTQGLRHVEVEIGAQRARNPDARATEVGVQLSYGFTPALDLIVRPTLNDLRPSDGAGSSRAHGAGDTDLGVKWRIAEGEGIGAGLRADVFLPTGDAERGLGAGKTTWRLVLIGSVEQGPWAVHGNIGLLHAPAAAGTRRDLPFVSAAVVWTSWETLHLTGELIASADADRARSAWPLSARVGVMADVTAAVRLDAGVERRLGGGPDHTIVLAGITLHW